MIRFALRLLLRAFEDLRDTRAAKREIERQCALFERDLDWYIRNGDGTPHRLLDVAPTLERDALKDSDHMAARRRRLVPHVMYGTGPGAKPFEVE